MAKPPESSNNWVVSGSRTATDRPILANDSHRALSVPSLRYVAHLSALGMDVIGAGEPALPGISISHNGKIAFGLTIFSIDESKLPLGYRHRANMIISAVNLFTRLANPLSIARSITET